jgi:hypothetical protein
MNPPVTPPDPLLEEYRRASRESAGAPSVATRAAILAEARAAALRRTPSANDAHWRLRAVAALAVVGLGAALWMQLSPQQRQRPITGVALAPAAAPAMSVSSPADAARSSRGVPLDIAPAPRTAKLESTQRLAEADTARTTEPQAPLPAPASRIAKDTANEPPEEATVESAVAGSARTAAAGTVANKASAEARRSDSDQRRLVPPVDDVALLFPNAWQNPTPPAAVWVLRSADGSVVLSGELAAGESIDVRYARIEANRPTQRIVERAERQLRNARGAAFRLYTARIVDRKGV